MSQDSNGDGGGLLSKDMKSPNHTRIDNTFLDNGYASELGQSAALVYLCICRFWSQKTQRSRISIKRIHYYTGLSKVTILKSLDKLSRYQIITYTAHQGRGKSNEYLLVDSSQWQPVNGKKIKPFSDVKKGLKNEPIQPIKGTIFEQEKVQFLVPLQKICIQGGGGSCSDSIATEDIGAEFFEKTHGNDNGNSASANSSQQRPPLPIFQSIPETSEQAQQRKLREQARQITGGAA